MNSGVEVVQNFDFARLSVTSEENSEALPALAGKVKTQK
jgi:hypothetical protein